MQEYSTVAAVDLGSNSFRLQIARVVENQFYPLDSLRETVRLAAGLNADKWLDETAQARALDCLKRFAERLRGLPQPAVRVVGTSTLRIAKNASAFLEKAEAVLGFPIEVVAGREEARLIYIGVAHSVPQASHKQLVVDIGGGSTECIIGIGVTPQKVESLHMGCVNFSARFFPDGKIDKSNLKRAEFAARIEVQSIAAEFGAGHWQEAIGSSGTARALADIMEQNGYSDAGITPTGLAKLRNEMLRVGDSAKLDLLGLKADRKPVLASGFAVMAAIFSELRIEHMTISNAAMREGILYDLIGRFHHQDLRETTVDQFMRRYQVDPVQASRVEVLCVTLFKHIGGETHNNAEQSQQHLSWAARLHEIGISIAHTGYHKHSAYIVANADMPGFSKMDQAHLALLTRAQRGSLHKMKTLVEDDTDWLLILCLRLAILFYRSRTDLALPGITLLKMESAFRLTLPPDWIALNPLTETALQAEIEEWASVGVKLKLIAE